MLEYGAFDFDLVNLPGTGKHWDTEILPALLQDAHSGQIDALNVSCSAARWSGTIVREHRLWQMQASLSLSVRRCCDRCLSEFDWQLGGACERSFAIAGSLPDGMDEDDDVTVLDAPGRLNIVDLLREEIWLAWKPVVICSEQCKGLCKSCGSNLNTAQCQCDGANEDHPFAVLRSLNFDE